MTILMMLGWTGQTKVKQRCGIDPTCHPNKNEEQVICLKISVFIYVPIENLVYTAMLNRISEAEATSKANAPLKRVGVEKCRWKENRQIFAAASAIGPADTDKNPRAIILDEPTSHDPRRNITS